MMLKQGSWVWVRVQAIVFIHGQNGTTKYVAIVVTNFKFDLLVCEWNASNFVFLCKHNNQQKNSYIAATFFFFYTSLSLQLMQINRIKFQ